MKKTKGIALIDLLIITAITAVLGAILLPNFWAAQTKARVSMAKADMKELSTPGLMSALQLIHQV
jgi:Tfp pilus assembly protein PilE